ncbi:MAG: SGNH/GDSL hydrolase family protein [Cyanobacteriota bacterium]|nr:SGNH/GDSL hydrolase family protein [Cyanobacteriota bacterium]
MRLAPVIQELLVFGDSLSDGGNARAALGDGAFPCPPHWNNRRCNGPLWVEHLAERLGLAPLLPSLAGGGNNAFGGARSGSGTTPKGLPNLLTQVEGFLRELDGQQREGVEPPRETRDPGAAPPLAQAAGRLSSGPLVVIRAGANDYLDAPLSPAVAHAVNRHLLAAVAALADRGLRQFLVPNELPWGFCPIALPGVGEPQRRAVNALIAQQNIALHAALEELAARRGLLVLQPDFHGLFLEIQAKPEAWGFRELARPVLGAGGQGTGVMEGGPSLAGSAGSCLETGEGGVPDAAGFLWWDAWGHFTSAFHRLLAGRAVEILREVAVIKCHATDSGI